MLLSDLFVPSLASLGSCGYARPIEATCDELAEAAEAHGLSILIYRFSELLPGQNLREHVMAAMDPLGSSQSTVGPWIEVWNREICSTPGFGGTMHVYLASITSILAPVLTCGLRSLVPAPSVWEYRYRE